MPRGPPLLEPTLTSLQLKQAEGQATLSREPFPTTPASTSMNEHSSGRLGGQSGGVEVESTANSTRLGLARRVGLGAVEGWAGVVTPPPLRTPPPKAELLENTMAQKLRLPEAPES